MRFWAENKFGLPEKMEIGLEFVVVDLNFGSKEFSISDEVYTFSKNRNLGLFKPRDFSF
jgi:hypothetical protein